MEINPALKSKFEELFEEQKDKPINKKIIAEMHMKLLLYSLKHFPDLTNKEINEQIKYLMFEIVKPYLE